MIVQKNYNDDQLRQLLRSELVRLIVMNLDEYERNILVKIRDSNFEKVALRVGLDVTILDRS